MDIKNLSESLEKEVSKIIVGKKEEIKLVIMAVLTGGHVLINDYPGVGKTTLIKTLSKALGCSFNRIQFVPDMVPSDIIGMKIFNQKTGDFELKEGPVSTNILLADEINRAIPRTQSALLEAMEEHQVSIDNETIVLEEPFLVLATQNPVEMESTFALPAAQMDRFLIELSLGYPKIDEEQHMLEVLGDEIPFDKVQIITNSKTLVKAQKEALNTYVSDEVSKYIVNLVNSTRLDKRLRLGASPRASRALYRAVKVWASMNGRDHVIPDDVQYLAHYVLDHRLVVENTARLSGIRAYDIVQDILDKTKCEPVLENIVSSN